ncbi:hypothetical protein [Salinispora pacifica]|uniref:hypothetical protein n=1 Tax=Salinispora pacifica TaxID=351187 RepID=UPI00036FD7CE|nr:hypothetical protein [Salinispora pacifica]
MTAIADAAIPYRASGLALTLGLIVTVASWFVALASWFNWKDYIAGGHEDRSVAAIALAITFGTAFMGTTWIEPTASLSTTLIDAVQKVLVALTLLSAVLVATIYWFNRPQLLVPARYRNDRGRWAERARHGR